MSFKFVRPDIFSLIHPGTYIRWQLRTRRKIDLFGEKSPICDYSRSDQMPLTDQITEIAPYVRTYF